MRVVLDLQGAQCEGRFHRSGHDTLCLALAIARHCGEHEVLIALNGLFPETIEPIRALFDGLLPQQNIRVWHTPGPVRADETDNAWRRQVAERIREAFLAGLQPDVVFVSSLFEGYGDEAVTSIGGFAPPAPTVVMLHDLIPLVSPEIHLDPDPVYAQYFAGRIEQLGRAAAVLSIAAAPSLAGFDSQRVERLDDEDTCSDAVEPAASPRWDVSARRALAVFERMQAPVGFDGHAALSSRLVESIAAITPPGKHDPDFLQLARSIAISLPGDRAQQFFIDVSGVVQGDAKTGIQRVTRSILKEFLDNPPAGYRVEPVYATPYRPGYRYARQYAAQLRDQEGDAEDEAIDYRPGDIFLGIDLQHRTVIVQGDYLQGLRRDGVKINFVVYDLLPIFMPHVFVLEPDAHKNWLETIAGFDGALCISRAVADELADWLAASGLQRARPFNIDWFHLGADIENSVPTSGLPSDAAAVLERIARAPTFLMVGTVEPRKGHLQTLDAFERLWARGIDVNLVIVGKQGWIVEALVKRLQQHTELGKRLFWLKGISDEYLEQVYAASACLIAASEGEGFGLPLIEAASHKLPIIARGLPVFREVAGEHAVYFDGLDPEELAAAVENWLALAAAGNAPQSAGMPWLTWAESAEQLKQRVCGHAGYKQWLPQRRSAK